MNDRQLLAALALIMVIALLPTFLMKRQAPKPPVPWRTRFDVPRPGSAVRVPTRAAGFRFDAGAARREDTVVVRSKLYRYAISTRGGRIISSRFLRYRSLA